MLLLDVVHAAWARGGLAGIRYRRHLGARRSPFGETIPLEIEVWNRRASPPGLAARGRRGQRGRRGPGARRSTRARGPARSSCATPGRSGRGNGCGAAFTSLPTGVACSRLGPVDLSIGDPFARACGGRPPPGHRHASSSGRGRSPRRSLSLPTAGATSSARGAAWPRIRPASRGCARTPRRPAAAHPRPRERPPRPPDDEAVRAVPRPGGADRARRPGRRGRRRGQAGWGGDDVERLCVVAASVARSLADAARRVRHPGRRLHGCRAAHRHPCPSHPRRARPSGCWTCWRACPGHASDAIRAAPGRAARTVRSGTTVLVITARDPRPFVPALATAPGERRRRGPGGVRERGGSRRRAARATPGSRRAGSSLDGHWRTAERLVIAR